MIPAASRGGFELPTSGPVHDFGFIAAGLVVFLAFIVAFGSLTFTIAAIVAAPQVSAFLGLTFYSAGLDKARAPSATPANIRWVSVPMTIAIACLAVAALAGIPSIASFQPHAGSPLLALLRYAAGPHQALVIPNALPALVSDAVGDEIGAQSGEADIVAADIAGLETIPDWLLDELFSCGAADVACSADAGSPIALQSGALLFAQRMAAAPARDPAAPHAEWGQMVRVQGQIAAPALAGQRYDGANVRFETELDSGKLTLRQFVYAAGAWSESFTLARSAWRDDMLITLVPIEDMPDEPTAWDVYAVVDVGPQAASDNIRPADGEVVELGELPWFKVLTPKAP